MNSGPARIEDGVVDRLMAHQAALPPVASSLHVHPIADPDVSQPPSADTFEAQPISGFTCVIRYKSDMRLIVCRRYDQIGGDGCIGAVCHTARGYRQFRVDRIPEVYDAETGELLGTGTYFDRFAVDGIRERAPTWGLSSSRKATLIAGLNVLVFMSRCDGHWHSLEAEIIERFICSLWLRKEWDGDPPIEAIMAHAERLSPDWAIVERALVHYTDSSTSTRILKQAIADLIAADGVICDEEHRWAEEIASSLDTGFISPGALQ